MLPAANNFPLFGMFSRPRLAPLQLYSYAPLLVEVFGFPNRRVPLAF